jgi:peptidyl-prolyl cis-trans isomerase B (cyclophilin B)
MAPAMVLLLLLLSLMPQQENPKDLQAVVETTSGTFIIQFHADEAPNHVRKFLELARQGFYNGTSFHTMLAHGVVQGGDPETKNPNARNRYGSGGFDMGLKPEALTLPLKAGTVVATTLPGKPDSAGSQFFICLSDQLQLNGQYTPFAYVVDGVDVLDKISMTPLDDTKTAKDRVEIKNVTIRRTPPPVPVPYAEETIEQLKQFQVVMETSKGKIVIDLMPDKAPNHVRHFLQLAGSGAYDNSAVHRIAPGFVIQAGDLNTRKEPLTSEMRKYVTNIRAEVNDVKHQAGIVSMARGEALDSGATSFFIVLGDQPVLDGTYTVFGKVVEGMDVVSKIAAVPNDNEKPREPVDIYSMRVVRRN